MTALPRPTDDLLEVLRAHLGASGEASIARHPVSEPAIADWCDAIGDSNPCYTDPDYARTTVHGGLVAPPAALDIWDRPGLSARPPADDPRGRALEVLTEHGFTGVVAVNSELEINRYLRPGDRLQNVQILEDISPRKHTGLGPGYFITTRHRYATVTGEHVGDLLFRILRYQPSPRPQDAAVASDPSPDPSPDPSLRPRPAISRDHQFLWDGYRRRELRIQSCRACGRLSFPPSPSCAGCGGFSMGWIVSAGRGRLYSYAVPHHPQVAGFRYPLLVGLIELDEGTRLVANITGCPKDRLRIGMELEVDWLDSHPALVEGATDSQGPITLPQFRPATPSRRQDTTAVADLAEDAELPVWGLPVTATRIVAGAVATRDFTEVHHDRALARARGSLDIFMNINTTLGLVERYATDWAGPQALVTALRVRLGAPAYPGDPLAFTGSVKSVDRVSGRVTVAVRAANQFGDHAGATVELLLPGGADYPERRG